MTTNTLNKPTDPELDSQEEVELIWPESKRSVDEAILLAYKTWVLRFILSNLATPSKVLNAMRRLEVMNEFPLRAEKQARTLALAEARVELRRRTLDLREALLKERQEKRETAAAKAAEKAANTAAKAKSVAPKPAPAPVAVPAAPVTAPTHVVAPIVAAQSVFPQTDLQLMPLTNKAFGPSLELTSQLSEKRPVCSVVPSGQ